MKKVRLKEQLHHMLQRGVQDNYLETADSLMDVGDPEAIIAALLQFTFGDELDEKSYSDIDNTAVDKKGKTRLFIKKGKRDGFSKKKLVDLIVTQCGIPFGNIRDVQMMDKFSFLTLPFHDAESVLTFFKKNKKSRLVVQKASNKKKKN